MSEIIREEENDLTSKNYIVIVDLVDWETDRLIASGCGSQYAQILAIRTMAKSLFPPVDARCVEQFLKGEYTMLRPGITEKQMIGGVEVTISRGSPEIPPGSTGGGSRASARYRYLYDAILEMRPGDPSLDIHYPDKRHAELARNVAHHFSCPVRGSTDRKKRRNRRLELPWPFAVTTRWIVDSEREPNGSGTLRIWVYTRE